MNIIKIKEKKRKMKKYEVIIIGGGPAAITISKDLKRKKDVAIIRPEDHSMIYCAMPYAIEGILDLDKTFKKDEIVTEMGTTLIRDYVTHVDFDKQIVTTNQGGLYQYEELIIATGAEPILPPIEGNQLEGVMTFKTEKDLEKVIETVETGLKEAVVVGAGAIGIELAQALNYKGVKTYLVDMFQTILPNMMDEDMIEQAQKKLEASGIELYLNHKVIKLEGEGHVEKILFENGNTISFSSKPLVVFAVGMKPSIDFLKDSPLYIGKTGIMIDEYMHTNIKNVYAVGDCCEYVSAITGGIILGKLATNAVPMGRLLAKNMLGEKRRYAGFYNGAATKVVDYFVGGTGLTENSAKICGYDYAIGRAKMTTAFPIMPFSKDIEVKLIVDKKSKKLIGGQVISGEPVTDKVDQITMAIQYGITIDQLAQISYASQPYQSFFPANNLLAHASENILSQL